ncbi:hypothetical protein XSP_002595 [Xanthomonas euroxanthea]|uniref:Uncharacterized protein n=1 Tax=Xanthomonas euroxanthea TaxID=2259622 RepID=A0A8E4E2G2_9XANT|nr:hypothetical protein [Xanthomonas euroxanthea]CAD1793318.1 hypothetical protein XSP_002595 [Xanthomonas euroxanthea]SYZ53880.1 hypothetical protein CPBF367_19610 [Xanthomonas arboricola pv. juglandis]
MDEYQHTVLTRGGYRVVAITREDTYAPDAVVAYAVVTDAGTRLTPDLSLDQARVWIDSLVESERGGRKADLVDHKPVVRR